MLTKRSRRKKLLKKIAEKNRDYVVVDKKTDYVTYEWSLRSPAIYKVSSVSLRPAIVAIRLNLLGLSLGFI